MAEEEQYQKPVGEEGKAVIAKMYEHHRELTIWGLANIPAKTAMNVLDVGCGGGMAVKMLALKYPNAKITGIDISEECIQATLDYNKVFHQWGKVDAKVASVEDVPFGDSSLDIITAVETYFFWPELKTNIAHLASKLSPGGCLCIISEQYFTDENREKMNEACAKYHMKLVENDVMLSFIEAAGLKTQMILNEDKGWVTYLGFKE